MGILSFTMSMTEMKMVMETESEKKTKIETETENAFSVYGVLSQQLLLFWYHTWSLQNDKCKKLFKCAQCKNIILRTFYLKKHLGTHKQKIICLQQLRQGIHWIAFSVSWVLVPTTFVILVSCMVTAKYTY